MSTSKLPFLNNTYNKLKIHKEGNRRRGGGQHGGRQHGSVASEKPLMDILHAEVVTLPYFVFIFQGFLRNERENNLLAVIEETKQNVSFYLTFMYQRI